jgi:hypothetical protein
MYQLLNMLKKSSVSGQLDKMEDLQTIKWDFVMSEKKLVDIDTRRQPTATATLPMKRCNSALKRKIGKF